VGLMGIGEFARLSRLSPKALRLYDELGLLPPARIDPDSGYRWYSAEQLDQARLVASLRQIGVPLARIKLILGLPAADAADEVGAYWADAEAGHAARRELAGYLADRLRGKRPVMYEVAVRDMSARSLLSVLRHAHADELMAIGKQFIARCKAGSMPLMEGVTGAPFVIYYGDVSEDSDGPVEWCWPVPDDQAAELADRFDDLTLRTEPAHEEAYIETRPGGIAEAAQVVPVLEALYGWATENHRRPTGGFRSILAHLPGHGQVPDIQWAIPLR
jgi:DNA-binding transcriptional MerR regulator